MSSQKIKVGLGIAAMALGIAIIGCGGSGGNSGTGGTTSTTSSTSGSTGTTPISGFTQTNLVSDQTGVASITDPNMVNPWGMAFSPTGAFWLADNGPGLATVYSGGKVGGTITNVNLNVTIPFGNPSGQVFNSTTDFVVTNGTASGPASFIFASETGWIDGWNGTVNGTTAEAPTVVSGAVYKGLAIGSNASGNLLFATDFAKGTIDVFDKNFNSTTVTGSFSDPAIPAGFAPFGIINVNGTLFVSYAKQDAVKHDDVAGAGNGYISTFDSNGNFLGRLVSQGRLNSPWGMTMVPAGFGSLSGMLLVGNFGDGWINVYNGTSGAYVGSLANASGTPISIPGLWAIGFGNGSSAGDTTSLYFTAGPGGENHGLFGRINAPSAPTVIKPTSARH